MIRGIGPKVRVADIMYPFIPSISPKREKKMAAKISPKTPKISGF
jgi:hypothetical protein